MANPNIWAPGSSITSNGTMKSESFIATESQTLFTLTAFTYSPGTGSLYVFTSGLAQRAGIDFTETSANSFTLASAVPVGTIVYAIAFTSIIGEIPAVGIIPIDFGPSKLVKTDASGTAFEGLLAADFPAFLGTVKVNNAVLSDTATNATNATDATNATNVTGTTTASIISSALGTGTADGTTILYGDRTWGVAPSFQLETLAKSANYTAVLADLGKCIEVDATAGAVTITLPSPAVDYGALLQITKVDSSANVVTVSSGGGAINSVASEYLLSAHDTLLMRAQTNGPRWHVISGRKTWVSAEQTITASTSLSITHPGLTIPDGMEMSLRCKVIDNGYAVGDEIPMPIYDHSSIGGLNTWKNTTNVGYCLNTNLGIFNKTSGVFITPTYSSWKAVFRLSWRF